MFNVSLAPKEGRSQIHQNMAETVLTAPVLIGVPVWARADLTCFAKWFRVGRIQY